MTAASVAEGGNGERRQNDTRIGRLEDEVLGSSGTAARVSVLEAEIRALRDEMAALRKSNEEQAKASRELAATVRDSRYFRRGIAATLTVAASIAGVVGWRTLAGISRTLADLLKAVQ